MRRRFRRLSRDHQRCRLIENHHIEGVPKWLAHKDARHWSDDNVSAECVDLANEASINTHSLPQGVRHRQNKPAADWKRGEREWISADAVKWRRMWKQRPTFWERNKNNFTEHEPPEAVGECETGLRRLYTAESRGEAGLHSHRRRVQCSGTESELQRSHRHPPIQRPWVTTWLYRSAVRRHHITRVAFQIRRRRKIVTWNSTMTRSALRSPTRSWMKTLTSRRIWRFSTSEPFSTKSTARRSRRRSRRRRTTATTRIFSRRRLPVRTKSRWRTRRSRISSRTTGWWSRASPWRSAATSWCRQRRSASAGTGSATCCHAASLSWRWTSSAARGDWRSKTSTSGRKSRSFVRTFPAITPTSACPPAASWQHKGWRCSSSPRRRALLLRRTMSWSCLRPLGACLPRPSTVSGMPRPGEPSNE